MDIFIYFILLIIFFGTLYYLKKRRVFELGKKFIGPPTIPFLGNGNLFLNVKPEKIFTILKDLHTTYGDCYRLWFGYDILIVFSDPKDIEVILSSTSTSMTTKSDDYKLLEPWLGSGLLLTSGHKWFSHRKALTPAFHFKILEQFIDDFDEQTNIFVDKLKIYCDNDQVFDIAPHVVLCALDIICVTSMGTPMNAQTNSDSAYCTAVRDLSHILYDKMFNIFTANDLYFMMTNNYNVQKKSIETLHKYTYKVIEKRRLELENKKNDNLDMNVNEDENDVGIKKKMPLLDVLLNVQIDGKPLTNDEIREEVDTFMFAGHDTTTSALSFLLYNLAKNPDIQNKTFDEIRNVIGDDVNKPATYKDLNELKYLEMVIKESLRMYPPVPYIARHFTDEHYINNKLVPNHSNVTIGIYLMNHNPKYFENPEEFIPERFDTFTNAEKQNPYAYVPFSAGPRNCIGQKFAMLEMKATISKILRHYELILGYPDEELILVAEIVLKSKNGINLKLKKRIYN